MRVIIGLLALLLSTAAVAQTKPTIPQSGHNDQGLPVATLRDLAGVFSLYADYSGLQAEIARALAAESLKCSLNASSCTVTPTGGANAALSALLSGAAPLPGLAVSGSVQGATINLTPPSGLGPAVATTQTLTGTATGQNFANNHYIAGDTVNLGSGFSVGWEFNHVFGGGATTGGRVAVDAVLRLAAPTNPANANRNYVGLQGSVVAPVGDNGTDLNGGARGALFGFSSFFRCGGTNYLECTGGEVNSFALAGSSMKYKALWSLVGGGFEDAVQGSSYDCMLCVSAQLGSVGFRDGILIGDMNGQFPLSPNAYALRMIGGIITGGIDLSGAYITGPAFRSPGYVVDGGGNLTAANVQGSTLQQNGISTVAQINAVFGACTSALRGRRGMVSDALNPTFLGALTGGGGTVSPIFCNGLAWVAG